MSIENTSATPSLTVPSPKPLPKTRKPPQEKIMKPLYAVELHSRQARRLFYGKWEHGKYGLSQYARMLAFLQHAYDEDDPYAAHFTFETHTLYQETRQKIQQIEIALQQELSKWRAFQIKIYTAEKPSAYTIKYKSFMGFMGAGLLVDVDHVVRTALTLKQLGIRLPKEQYDFDEIHKDLLRLFEFPSRWHQTGVTRQDIYDKTERAQQAKAKMGKLPVAVLEKKITLPFLEK